MSDTPIYDQLKREWMLRELMEQGKLTFPNIKFDPRFLKLQIDQWSLVYLHLPRQWGKWTQQ